QPFLSSRLALRKAAILEGIEPTLGQAPTEQSLKNCLRFWRVSSKTFTTLLRAESPAARLTARRTPDSIGLRPAAAGAAAAYRRNRHHAQEHEAPRPRRGFDRRAAVGQVPGDGAAGARPGDRQAVAGLGLV